MESERRTNIRTLVNDRIKKKKERARSNELAKLELLQVCEGKGCWGEG